MRIASLVPSATEMCFALGLGDFVVAVTHECDYPDAARRLPRLTSSLIPEGLDAAEIDAAVKRRTAAGESLYRLDREALERVRADLIVTQAVCPVCAVSYEEVCSLASALPGGPTVLRQDPVSLTDVLDDAVELGRAAGDPAAGVALRNALAERIETVRNAVAGLPRPRVAAIEWLDPTYAAGHWVPEMIDAAGGVDALTAPGERSRELGWAEIAAAQPEVAVVMPCGLYCEQSAAEADRHADELAALGVDRAFAVDAASSFSRPGPRLADGIELLGHLLHPGHVAAPDGLEFAACPPAG